MEMNDEYRLIEYDDYWILPLAGKPVGRYFVDSRLTLEFFEPESETTMIVLGGDFTLEIDGKKQIMTAENPTTLGPVFALYRSVVESALAHKDGKLEINFRGGAKIIADPHPRFESWEVVGTRHLRVISQPGGGLAIWKPDP